MRTLEPKVEGNVLYNGQTFAGAVCLPDNEGDGEWKEITAEERAEIENDKLMAEKFEEIKLNGMPEAGEIE